MERAFRTSPIPEEPSEMNIPSFTESDQTIPEPILSDVVVTPVESIQTIKSEEGHKESEKRYPTLDDGVYFLEQLLLPTHTKTDQLERGQLFSEIRADVACEEMGFTLAKDGDEGYTLLGKHLKESNWFGAAEGVVRVLGDAITKATVDFSDTARFVTLLSLFVVDSALAILRDSQPRFQPAAGMGDAVLDHIRETLGSIGIMNETPVASVIGQCHKILMGANESEGQLRNKSSLELMDACRTGNPFRAGEILASKTLRKAEDQLRDIDQFRSTSDILTETPSTTIKPKRSKKKINCDGLPMPSRVSSISKTSLSKPTRSSSSYEPIRDMLLAEEREAHISRIVSTSNTSLPTEGREESQQFARRISDTSLALSEGNLTHGYVRKIQSKEHVYYIDSVGQIKKKAKKKKSSRSKRSLTKDDLNLHRDQEQDDLPSDEPKAISSEVDLVPTPPGNVPSDASRKSIEVRRSSFKRRESNLQMIAVINSSYTNMHRKSGDVSKTVIDQDGGAGSSEDKAKRKSIDEMLAPIGCALNKGCSETTRLRRVAPFIPTFDVESIQTIKSEENQPEKRFPTLDDGVYFLEQLLLPTHTKTDQLERGQLFSEIRADVACEEMGFTLAKDGDEGYTLLGKHLKESNWFGAAEGVVRVLGDAIGKATEDFSDTARFVTLLSLFVVDSALAILRDSQPRFQSAAGMGDAVLDHIRETLGSIGIMNETPVASVIGQCHKILMGATESEGQLRNKSSLELMDACRTGNPFRAGEILASKTLRKAEDQLRDIDQFRSTSDILTETPSTTIKPKRSKKKINSDGLPMPSRVSSTSKTSLSKPTRSSSSYEPIRDMLLAEEREAHISRIVSTSNASLPTEGREESQQFARRISDTSLALSEGNLTHGYVRKIQSKEHVYYIDSVGQIKKKAKKKKSSRSRRSLTKDDLNLHRDQDQDDLPSDEPKAISSEVDLVPTPPGNVPSDASRKSIEVRRSSFKRRESNLQMIAVINSSYTNMHRKSGDLSKTVIDQDGGAGSSEDKARRKSIDEMLSETDRELIKKLSNKSATGDQSDSEGEDEK
eukprot:sb/3461476/